jgi:hypothetical protein
MPALPPFNKIRTTMKLTATIRPTETRIIAVEADDYETGKARLEAQVPEGWQILQILNTP